MKILLACLLLHEFLVFCGNTAVQNYIPEMHQCYVSDSNVLECLKKQSALMLKIVQDGNLYFRIPPLNPFYINYLPLPFSRSFTLELSQVYIYGITEAKLSSFLLNVTTNYVSINWFLEKLRIKAKYRLNGNIFFIDIDTAGPLNISIDECYVDMTLPYEPIKNENRAEYFCGLEMFLASMSFDWKTYYPSDQGVVRLLNQYTTRNWELIMQQFKSPYKVALRNVLLPILDRIIKHVPINKLIPLKRKHPGEKRPVVNASADFWDSITG